MTEPTKDVSGTAARAAVPEIAVAIGVVALGVFTIVDAHRITIPLSSNAVGPRVFPYAVGVALIVAGLAVVLAVLRGEPADPEGGEDIDVERADRLADPGQGHCRPARCTSFSSTGSAGLSRVPCCSPSSRGLWGQTSGGPRPSGWSWGSSCRRCSSLDWASTLPARNLRRGEPPQWVTSAPCIDGFGDCAAADVPPLCPHRGDARHGRRRAAGHRPRDDGRAAAPADLQARADGRVHHVRRHLLRRHVRRVDDLDPVEHAGGVASIITAIEGNRMAQIRPRGGRAGHRGHRLVRGRHHRHYRPHPGGADAGQPRGHSSGRPTT